MLIYTMWFAGIAFKAFAAHRMVRNGLIEKLFPVCSYLAVSALYLGILLLLRPNPAIYLRVYSAGIPFLLAAKCAGTICIFWALAENYPNFRVAGSVFLGLFAIVGVIAAWLTSFVPATAHWLTPPWMWRAALLTERFASAVIAGTLLSSLVLLPRAPRIPIPRYARLAAKLMIFDALMNLASALFAASFAYGLPTGTALVATFSGMLTGAAWLRLRPFEELPVSLPSPEEIEAARQRASQQLRLIAARIDEAARALDRD
jgi:hypothetical protein